MRALVLCVLATVLHAGPAGVDRHRWAGALELRSRHYVVETNVFGEVAQSLSARLEESYSLFQDRFGVLTGRAARRMRVALYRTSTEYMELGDGVKGAIGHFDAALDRCALAWRKTCGATGWPIAIHEACHHYFRRRHPNLAPPSWYTEGIACYFEGLQDATVEDGVARARVRAARAALVDGEADLDKLLSTRARVVDGTLRLESYGPVRYYALVWSLAHFLCTDARYRAPFRRFELRLLNSEPRAAAREEHAKRLLVEECGNLLTIQEHWRTHIERLRRPAPPKPPPVYAWELTSASAFVRYNALRRLDAGDLAADLEPGVRRCLSDGDLIVRTAAARLMAGRMDERAVPAMVAALDLGDFELKRVALKALARPCARAAVPRLLKEQTHRAEAYQALAAIGDSRAFPALRAALLDRLLPAVTRARCAAALDQDPGAVLVLTVAAKDASRLVRNAARAALLRQGHDGRKQAATIDLELVRRYVAHDRGGPKSVGALIAQLGDPTVSDRDKARACTLLALGRAGGAVGALRRLCGPKTPDSLRLEAVRALVHITGESRGFVPGQPAREREAALRRWASE